MPTQLNDDLFELGGITKRCDPSDCLIMSINSNYKSLYDLPDNSVIGTSSVRRSAQLKKNFPNLKFESVRGNIHTRLKKLDDPNTPYECIILASAGLIRMGLQDRITQRFDSNIMYHAVGQGALGIEIRKNDTKIKNIIKKISDKNTTICCLAERSLMKGLEAGCSVPLGVNSNYDPITKKLHLIGSVIDVDGKHSVTESITAIIDSDDDAINCGLKLCKKMIDKGAKDILDKINLNELK